jgi:hypothetical protein
MLKVLALAGLAALIAACAAPVATNVADPMYQSRGSTPLGASKAADLGFHGPVDRSLAADGPN